MAYHYTRLSIRKISQIAYESECIYSSFPPWTLALPVIRLDLAALPRSSNLTHDKHIKAIIVNEFSSSLCYTDGSKSGTRTGYAFSINGVITHHHLRNSTSIFLAELLAIYSCLSHLSLLPPPHKFLLLSDSLSSLQAMQDPHSPDPIVQRIFILLPSLFVLVLIFMRLSLDPKAYQSP